MGGPFYNGKFSRYVISSQDKYESKDAVDSLNRLADIVLAQMCAEKPHEVQALLSIPMNKVELHTATAEALKATNIGDLINDIGDFFTTDDQMDTVREQVEKALQDKSLRDGTILKIAKKNGLDKLVANTAEAGKSKSKGNTKDQSKKDLEKKNTIKKK